MPVLTVGETLAARAMTPSMTVVISFVMDSREDSSSSKCAYRMRGPEVKEKAEKEEVM